MKVIEEERTAVESVHLINLATQLIRKLFIYERAFFLSHTKYLVAVLRELGLARIFAFSFTLKLAPGETKIVEAEVPKGYVKINLETHWFIYTNWKIELEWYRDDELFLYDAEMTSRSYTPPYEWYIVYNRYKVKIRNTDTAPNKVKSWGIAVFVEKEAWNKIKETVFQPYIREVLPVV